MPSKAETNKFSRFRWELPYGNYPATGPTHTDSYTQYLSNDLLASSNHGRAFRRGLDKAGGDLGGEFYAVKRSYEEYTTLGEGSHAFTRSSNPYQTGGPRYECPQFAYRDSFNNTAFPVPTPSTVQQLNAFGTTAWSRCAPNKPAADIATFLGEAREGFPSAVGLSLTGKARARRAVNAGDEYLNIEFGWKPLLRDVRSFAQAVKNSHEILEAYKRKSGVLLKRRYEFPLEGSVKEETLNNRYAQPLLAGALYGTYPSGTLTRVTESSIRRWFTASFMYSVPTGSVPDRYLSDANALLGAKLSPNMLWNIAPWSWAADWVGNVGDIAANMTYIGSDGLVAHHAYIMEHRSTKETNTLVLRNPYKTYPGPQVLTQVFIGETKRRLNATPYGFGLNWNGFNAKQLGIIGALGISKLV